METKKKNFNKKQMARGHAHTRVLVVGMRWRDVK